MSYTDKQLCVFRGFAQSSYIQMSATELGDLEVAEMFKLGLVERYWGGGIMWHLTRKGREEAARLGLRQTADINVIDAAIGKVERARE